MCSCVRLVLAAPVFDLSQLAQNPQRSCNRLEFVAAGWQGLQQFRLSLLDDRLGFGNLREKFLRIQFQDRSLVRFRPNVRRCRQARPRKNPKLYRTGQRRTVTACLQPFPRGFRNGRVADVTETRGCSLLAQRRHSTHRHGSEFFLRNRRALIQRRKFPAVPTPCPRW